MVIQTQIHSLCPECHEICNGTIIHNNNEVFIQIQCPTHGEQLLPYFEDAKYYDQLQEIVAENKEPLQFNTEDMIINHHPASILTSVHINFTERCNLKCKNCFANSKTCDENEISIQTIVDQLKQFDKMKHKPMIVVIGGEPTVRNDLKDLVKVLSDKGYFVRIGTNGIRLLNKDYMKELIEYGLSWIILQFDGFKPETSLEFRGFDLTQKKMQVIQNATEMNLKTHLTTMISKEYNIDESYKILEFAFNHPNIFSVNYYPVTYTGRYKQEKTTALDCFNALEEQSEGRITKEDFLECKKLWNRIYKIYKWPFLRQKMCRFSLFLYKRKGKLYPINRLFKIKNILQHPVFTLRYLFKLPQMLRWVSNPSKNFLYMNIEKFFDDDAMNIEEAYNCHNLFVTDKGFIPLCIYNSLYRNKMFC